MNIYAFADEASAMIDGQIDALRQNGLNGLEIRNVDKVNVSSISDAKAKEVKKKLDDTGFQVWSIGSPIGKIHIERDDFNAHTELFRRTLEIAKILGAEHIRLFSFFPPKGKDPEDYRQEVINRLGLFCDLAQGTGITLCHENEKEIYGDIASRCLEIHRALPQLRAVFDPANFIQCGQDTWEAWEQLKGYVEYLHIKDALSDGSVVPAGKGVGNVARILESYAALGGQSVSLEPHLTIFEGFDKLEQGMDAASQRKPYSYPSATAAFAAAADALKELLG